MNKKTFGATLVALAIAILLVFPAPKRVPEPPPSWEFQVSPAGDLITITPPQDQPPTEALAACIEVHLQATSRTQSPTPRQPSIDDPGAKIWGTGSVQGDHLLFRPAVSLTPGQSYLVGIRSGNGPFLASTTLSLPTTSQSAPQVSIHPAHSLPANALKLYLQFSRPMEQGVMLENLRFLDASSGAEVVGAFRETELWSPDGRRLTVWFHPGRQKTDVQLGIDEGPVLSAGRNYQLSIDGRWRDTAGQPLGTLVQHAMVATTADHHSPDPSAWKIAANRRSITVTFDESLDLAMLPRSLTLTGPATATQPIATDCIAAPDGCSATLTPTAPLVPGAYTLHIDPLLEDLAGNNLEHPFEVDLTQPAATSRPVLERRFEISD